MGKKRIAILASGSGTNAENIFKYFSDNEDVVIDSLWSNKADAYALVRARNFGVESFVFDREKFYQTDMIADTLRDRITSYNVCYTKLLRRKG